MLRKRFEVPSVTTKRGHELTLDVLLTIDVYDPSPEQPRKKICTVTVEVHSIKDAEDQLALMTRALMKAGLQYE